MNEIKLYEFIDIPNHPPIEFLGRRYSTVDVPTEFVVTEPKFCVPTKAKIYFTNHYVYDGKVLYSTDLGKAVEKKEGGFKGCYHYDQVRLVEVWYDQGDDGHRDYTLRGWIFVTQSHLDQCMGMMERWDNLPYCITHAQPWGDGTYVEEFEEWKGRYEDRNKDGMNNEDK